jgi:NADPH:quinone reductase-like Zn-dependent oxidoreductase
MPIGLDLKVRVAALLQGMTAHYLAYTTYPLKSGDTCLIHAAAGGVGLLSAKGSLFFTWPSLAHYIADRPSLEKRAGDVLSWIAAGQLKLRREFTFPLSETDEAHQSLESRKTTGKILLIPPDNSTP